MLITFVIPGYFYNRLSNSEVDVGGVHVVNRKLFTEQINENMTGKQIPGMMAHSVEFSKIKVKSKEELDILMKIKNCSEVKDSIPKDRPNQPKVNVKPICLLMGYMYDLFEEEDYKLETVKEDLEIILRAIPSYMDIMLTQTMSLAQAFKMQQSPKKITAKNIMTLIQFDQNLMQGGWISKDPYMQLPMMDQVLCGKLKNKLNGMTLFNYCRKSSDERKAIMSEITAGSDKDANMIHQEQEKCIACLPLVKLTMTAEVVGEDEVVVGDILTCKMRVDYYNIDKGQKQGYVHSKHYPYLKKDSWYLIITDDTFTNLAAVEKLEIRDNFYEKEFKERIGRPGKISFTAVLANDSYKGIDQFSKVEIEVQAEAKNRVTMEYSKEDLKAVKEQNMLASALMEEESDTDEDEADDVDEGVELMNKLKAAGLEKAVTPKDVIRAKP